MLRLGPINNLRYRVAAPAVSQFRPRRQQHPSSAGVPEGQLGMRALSQVGVQGTCYHLTQRKIRGLLDQLMGLGFSLGSISQAHSKVASALKAPWPRRRLSS
jgi:hypothetical protein